MPPWIHRLAGRFVVFDGPDGSGKTTQLERFAEHCRSAGLVLCEVREPGGTAIGEQIPEVFLAGDAFDLNDFADGRVAQGFGHRVQAPGTT